MKRYEQHVQCCAICPAYDVEPIGSYFIDMCRMFDFEFNEDFDIDNEIDPRCKLEDVEEEV